METFGIVLINACEAARNDVHVLAIFPIVPYHSLSSNILTLSNRLPVISVYQQREVSRA